MASRTFFTIASISCFVIASSFLYTFAQWKFVVHKIRISLSRIALRNHYSIKNNSVFYFCIRILLSNLGGWKIFKIRYNINKGVQIAVCTLKAPYFVGLSTMIINNISHSAFSVILKIKSSFGGERAIHVLDCYIFGIIYC